MTEDQFWRLEGQKEMQNQQELQFASGNSPTPEVKETDAGIGPPKQQHVDEYTSRYVSDFEHIQVLGKGGFGIVFEAKKIVDDCYYAIKRIDLPNSEEPKKKVMREVKALAKLDNVDIVRYYSAWIESPPPGRQEEWDKQKGLSECSTSTSEYGGHTDRPYESSPSWSSERKVLEPPRTASNVNKLPKKPSLMDIFENQFGENSFEFNESDKGGSEHITGESQTSSMNDEHRDEESEAMDVEFKLSNEHVSKDQTKTNSIPITCRQPKSYLYIQMKLCNQESLKDRLSSNTLDRDKHVVLDIFDQIACAIEYVHEQGLMHRDLKPSNIFLTPNGVIKIGDFGLVTAQQNEVSDDEGNPVKKHTAQVGTQLYMSPEQAKGEEYSEKVDVFALGVILFELLYPFQSQHERIQTLECVKKRDFPSNFCKDMPNECEFVRSLLAPLPEVRPTVKDILCNDLLKEFVGQRMPSRFREVVGK